MRTLKQLIEYCREHDIFVPGNPTKEYLHAAIVRAFQHESEPEVKPETCFGYWEKEHPECMMCDYHGECSLASMGMDVEKYERSLNRSNSGVRLKGRMRK